MDFLKEEFSYVRMALGDIQGKLASNDKNEEYKVFSEWGGDGIIQFLINNLNIQEKTFIEFGVENYTESNTRYLLMHDNWTGLVIDGGADNIDYIKRDPIYWRYNLTAVQAFITRENVNDIFLQHGMSGHIGLLSIDIDGNDYWVWDAINVVDPDIVICEYNSRFGKDRAVTIPYDPTWTRFKVEKSEIYFGASIRALVALGQRKGYALVAGNQNANDLFFVKRSLLNDIVRPCTIDEAYHVNLFRDARDAAGKLLFLNHEQEQEIIAKCPV